MGLLEQERTGVRKYNDVSLPQGGITMWITDKLPKPHPRTSQSC